MSATAAATTRDYAAFASGLVASGLITDPWVDAQPRFATAPVVLSAGEAELLARAAEAMAGALHEVALRLMREPELAESFFALSPVQKLMWQSSAPLWHGIARADVFFVDGDAGPRAMVCELNADTPSGQPEAVLLGPATGVVPGRDPNAGLERAFARLLAFFLGQVDRAFPDRPPTVGIVYPTEIAGDFGLVRLYQRWCENLGYSVVLGSPYNLMTTAQGGVALFGSPCDLILRHYKTDWWGERWPLWADEDPLPDTAPLAGPLAVLLAALGNRRCAVVNPLGSVLIQNKRALAFLWERQHELSPAARAAVQAHLPPTYRLETLDADLLVREQNDWVLKSDYGCEGEEVIIGATTSPERWQAALALALPRRFVAQRFFAARTGGDGTSVNHGVYLVAGRAAGIYARLARGGTDQTALSAAVEVGP